MTTSHELWYQHGGAGDPVVLLHSSAADPLPEGRHGGIDLSLIAAPALVVAGGHDLPYFRESARHIAGNIADATLIELDWAGHLPNLERPEEVTSLLLKLL
ncbi:alpha/beta fold hydrolase [Sphaerimonospora cavernae]|uniref:Alpha/beta fold hydrolase n=1 Tax=Sphaerimonospora cavernae TaxID=1740611 RepID=A0ABV6UDD0_9ACTN